VAVTTGLFGTRHSIIPADAARFADGGLHLPFSKAQVKAAPAIADDAHLDPEEEQALRSHYSTGLEPDAAPPAAGTPDVDGPGAADRTVAITRADTPGGPDPELHGRHAAAVPEVPVEERPHPDRPADGAMTRSEEQLRVGSERVATRRARLVKYVVTEEVQVTVPVRREEVRVEYDDVDTGNVVDTDTGAARGQAAPGERGSLVEDERAAGGGLPEEIVLHAERPVVTVEVVPTERVRLRTEEVEGQEQVGARLQREQVVVDQSPAPGRREDRPGV
jgi:stress response protein YsnF